MNLPFKKPTTIPKGNAASEGALGDIDNRYRPIPFYFINTTREEELSEAAVQEAMIRLRDDGFGGALLFNKPPDGFSAEEYLSDRWFEVIERFVSAGREIGLEFWINDGHDFPPGDAGGRIARINPTLKQRMLTRWADGAIAVEEVAYGVPAFEEPESSELFIQVVYEEYFKHLGRYFGKGISGFFSDADSRRLRPIAGGAFGKRYFPWSKNFAADFAAAFGYGIEPFLSDVLDEKGTSQVRDYWDFCGRLYARWFAGNYRWCQAHGVKYSFHTSDLGPFPLEQSPHSSIYTEGAFLYRAAYSDYPGTDHELLSLDGGTTLDFRFYTPRAAWHGDDQSVRFPSFANTKYDVRAKYASSAAYLFRKPRVLCEAFAGANWGCSHQDLRRISSWQLMQGIDFFVPHAVHHRLRSPTKFFAPPEFSRGSLRHGLCAFNDYLGDKCRLLAQTELMEPLAILDPTRAIWMKRTDAAAFYELFDRLNRLPYNHVIVDDPTLQADPSRFRFLLLPGIEAEKETVEKFKAAGGVILRHDELDRLPQTGIMFDGGAVHFQRRRRSDGAELLLVANIWNDSEITGTLHFDHETYHIALAAGEIAVLGADVDSFREPIKVETMIELPSEFDVEWQAENNVPLVRWEDDYGQVYALESTVPLPLYFEWENVEAIPPPRLLLPANLRNHCVIACDGRALSAWQPEMVLDEEYLACQLAMAGAKGRHRLELRQIDVQLQLFAERISLNGDFSVDIETRDDFAVKFHRQHIMELFLPRCALVKMRQRNRKLSIGSWAEQGAPFYSGEVTYRMKFEIPSSLTGATLFLPGVCHYCRVRLDETELGERIWAPYDYVLGTLRSGGHNLEVSVINTLANQMETYRAPSGLTARPYIGICKGND